MVAEAVNVSITSSEEPAPKRVRTDCLPLELLIDDLQPSDTTTDVEQDNIAVAEVSRFMRQPI
jgi:hypothetical protein